MVECRKTSRNAASCACGGMLYEDDAGWVYCTRSDALLTKSFEEPRHINSCERDAEGVWTCESHCPVRRAQAAMFS